MTVTLSRDPLSFGSLAAHWPRFESPVLTPCLLLQDGVSLHCVFWGLPLRQPQLSFAERSGATRPRACSVTHELVSTAGRLGSPRDSVLCKVKVPCVCFLRGDSVGHGPVSQGVTGCHGELEARHMPSWLPRPRGLRRRPVDRGRVSLQWPCAPTQGPGRVVAPPCGLLPDPGCAAGLGRLGEAPGDSGGQPGPRPPCRHASLLGRKRLSPLAPPRPGEQGACSSPTWAVLGDGLGVCPAL